MRAYICAAVIAVMSIGAANASPLRQNSTDQHHADRHNFYDNVPDFRDLFSQSAALETPASQNGHSHPVVR